MKTEAIWFGTKAGLKKLNGADVNLHVADVTIQPVSVVRYLGVWLDSELSMKTHINKTVIICFYQLRRLIRCVILSTRKLLQISSLRLF